MRHLVLLKELNPATQTQREVQIINKGHTGYRYIFGKSRNMSSLALRYLDKNETNVCHFLNCIQSSYKPVWIYEQNMHGVCRLNYLLMV